MLKQHNLREKNLSELHTFSKPWVSAKSEIYSIVPHKYYRDGCTIGWVEKIQWYNQREIINYMFKLKVHEHLIYPVESTKEGCTKDTCYLESFNGSCCPRTVMLKQVVAYLESFGKDKPTSRCQTLNLMWASQKMKPVIPWVA